MSASCFTDSQYMHINYGVKCSPLPLFYLTGPVPKRFDSLKKSTLPAVRFFKRKVFQFALHIFLPPCNRHCKIFSHLVWKIRLLLTFAPSWEAVPWPTTTKYFFAMQYHQIRLPQSDNPIYQTSNHPIFLCLVHFLALLRIPSHRPINQKSTRK